MPKLSVSRTLAPLRTSDSKRSVFPVSGANVALASSVLGLPRRACWLTTNAPYMSALYISTLCSARVVFSACCVSRALARSRVGCKGCLLKAPKKTSRCHCNNNNSQPHPGTTGQARRCRSPTATPRMLCRIRTCAQTALCRCQNLQCDMPQRAD